MAKAVNNKQNNPDLLGKIFIALLLVIFGGVVIHAPVTVGLENIWPQYGLLFKSWKEVLMLVAGLVSLAVLVRDKKLAILKCPILIAIELYAALHIILAPYNFHGLTQYLAGIAIDLRYVLFFALVYIAMKLYPSYRKMFIKVGLAGALIVVVFAILQVFVLPYDFLRYLGYNKSTIVPYLVVDENFDFIRINSTLRGPNPLGAYSVIVLAMTVAAIIKSKIEMRKWPLITTMLLLVGGFVALWSSYSRSALVGAVIASLTIIAAAKIHKPTKKTWIAIGVSFLVIFGAFFAIRNTNFVSNVLLHYNPKSTNTISSNEGHINSLSHGLKQLIYQPIGSGIGSTGSASTLGDHTEIIENHYLFVAHEVGWVGVALFMFIFGWVMVGLWRLRHNWFALGTFASGVGLALIGLLLPVWADDTVSIIWWGMAAIAMFPPSGRDEL